MMERDKEQNENILEIDDLKLSLPVGAKYVEILHGVSIDVKRGKILGILGESGSGKTVTMTAATGLLDQGYCDIHQGGAYFHGEDLLKQNDKALASIRGRQIGFVFQNAIDSMNPYKKVRGQLEEVFKLHNVKVNARRIEEALESVGIKDSKSVLNMYPSQLSGGMAQRVMIAMAGLLDPDLIIADEPTSAIDASLRKMVLDLFISVKKSRGISIAMITHDFDVVAYACDDVAVMYSGLIMESGPKTAIMKHPRHPYTAGLIECAQSLGKGDINLFELPGHPPSPQDYENLCPFKSRCDRVVKACTSSLPPVRQVGVQSIRCHNPLEVKVDE
ncbi:ABC transporter ATP-binding protein [Fusibacter sp. JL216-2]|uniref:ABC transporter ATP-binding protein n=1 Tax=Fusibacter sp. JL216-2 TaxID=3071453 RepID=UPI003D3495EB